MSVARHDQHAVTVHGADFSSIHEVLFSVLLVMAGGGAVSLASGRVVVLVHPRFAHDPLEVTGSLGVTACIGDSGIEPALDRLGVVVASRGSRCNVP